jgi:hypothetical protein
LRLPYRQQQNRKENTWIKVPEQRNKGIGESIWSPVKSSLGQLRLLARRLIDHARFPLRILWCSQSGDHPENNLVEFCDILNMKVGKKTESFEILDYLLVLTIKIWQFGKQFFEIWRIWVIFFP